MHPNRPRSPGITILQREVGAPNPPITLTIQSTILGEVRRIYVQLPEGHGCTQRRYPVLFVLDGEWIFESARASVRFFSEADVMDITIPKMIVVGIENMDRDRDYVPTPDPKAEPDYPTAGEADRFIQFLAQELIPFLDQHYCTVPSRTLIGWSFGGLFAMYSAVAMPELFDAYLCIGPAIWWDDDLVFKLYEQVQFERPKRMLMTVGSGEKGGWVYTSTQRILEQFEQHPIPGLSVSFLELEGVGHSWGIPVAIDKGLQALFRGYIPPAEIACNSLGKIERYYQNISETWGFQVLPPAPVMMDLARKQWSDDCKDAAVISLDHLLEYEPRAALAHYLKGRFQFQLGDYQQAAESFQKALDAENQRTVPDRLNLRLFGENIKKVEKVLVTAVSDEC